MGILYKDILTYDCFKTMPYEKDNKLFYGVELEVEANSLNYLDIQCVVASVEKELGPHANLRPEGSIGTCGFEIVTVPATLAYHKQVLWGEFFDKSATNVRASNATGLHIHFSREALTDKQLAKVIYFIHETANSAFLTKIAGRKVWEGANWCTQRKKTYNGSSAQEQDIINTENGSRTAISISQHYRGKSVEVRIFKSNPTRAGVFQALEFLDALISYCGKCKDNEDALTARSFLTWFNDSGMKMQYPYLYDNLLLLGCIERGWKILAKKMAG